MKHVNPVTRNETSTQEDSMARYARYFNFVVIDTNGSPTSWQEWLADPQDAILALHTSVKRRETTATPAIAATLHDTKTRTTTRFRVNPDGSLSPHRDSTEWHVTMTYQLQTDGVIGKALAIREGCAVLSLKLTPLTRIPGAYLVCARLVGSANHDLCYMLRGRLLNEVRPSDFIQVDEVGR